MRLILWRRWWRCGRTRDFCWCRGLLSLSLSLRLRLSLGGGAGLGGGLLLAELLGALGFEDALHALVLETLGLDLLETFDLGLGGVLRLGVGVALLLQLVLLVLEVVAQLLEVGGSDGVLVHRRRRAVRGRGDELVGDDLIGRGLRALEDRHRSAPRRHVAVDRHLFRVAAQFVEICDQGVVLRLQLIDLVVDRFEIEAGLRPCGGGGVGAIAGRLDLGSCPSGSVVIALGCRRGGRGRTRPDGASRPTLNTAITNRARRQVTAASVADVFQLDDDHDEPAAI